MSDILFHFSQWLSSTWISPFALNLNETGISQWLDTHRFAIPIMQVIHILALGTGFGAVLMIDLRVFNLAGTERTFAETERRYVRWIWWSLLVLLITGIGMTVAEPPRELINPIFWIKMPTVAFAALVSLWFHNRVMRKLAGGAAVGVGTKLGALFVILLWIFIMFCGRCIAYAPT
jgi:hypothetical protein